MEAFLGASKSALIDLRRFERVKVVLGNCTCDLDSAICPLAQGLFYYNDLSDSEKKNVAVIPVMNISEREYRIKTEVVWFLRENGLVSSMITFRNQIDLQALAKEKRLELTLVDHHTLSDEDLQLKDSVVEIIDHRPQDPNWLWPGTNINLDPVGSCATLVAKNILTKNPKMFDVQLRNLLRGPILVDTHNFSVEADRAKPLDHEVIQELEKTSSALCPRDDLYAQIMEAKTDVSGLTGEDLLMKDLKVVNDVAIPGFPILVEKFIELPNALEDVLSFTKAGSFTLAILLGMDLKGEKMRRDIGVFVSTTSEEDDLESRMVSSLLDSTDPPLGLRPSTTKHSEDLRGNGKAYKFLLFIQENVRATRKQILPIVQRASAHRHC